MKSNHKHMVAVAFAIALTLVMGCASKQKKSDLSEIQQAGQWRLASLEISYVLGHTVYRLITTGGSEAIHAEAFRDKRLLKQSTIDPVKYTDLVKQASELVTSLQEHPVNQPSACRTPFTLKIRSEHEIKSIDGCRSSDAGAAVGKLIKNAEYLLYSKN